MRGDSNVYIVDTGNNRIVELDASYKPVRVITEIYINGEPSALNSPYDVFVKENGDFYIADTGNLRVLHTDKDFNAVHVITKPEEALMDAASEFLPTKLVVDSADRIYNGGEKRPYDDCPGCGEQAAGKPHPCMDGDSCEPLRCAEERQLANCYDCPEYACGKAVAGYRGWIEAKSVSADDVTWGILPYVDWQYGN